MTPAESFRIGIKTSQQDTDWRTLDADWTRIGEHDAPPADDGTGLRHVQMTSVPMHGPRLHGIMTA